MGKNHRKNKKKRAKARRGWDHVILPGWLPECPICDSTRNVAESEDEAIVFHCGKCECDFVVFADGDSVPIEELDEYGGEAKKVKAEAQPVGSAVYATGDMVEDTNGAV